MSKKIVVAKLTADINGKKETKTGKRETTVYDEASKINTQLIADANVGLTLRVQRNIREALKEKYGLKTISTGGESVDLSAVESV